MKLQVLSLPLWAWDGFLERTVCKWLLCSFLNMNDSVTVHIINPHTTILFVTIPQGYIPWQAEIWCYALWTTTLGGHKTSLIYWSSSQTGPSTTFMHSSFQRRDTFLPSLNYQATPCLKSKNIVNTNHKRPHYIWSWPKGGKEYPGPHRLTECIKQWDIV